MKILQANIIDSDGTPRFAASHLMLFCLPTSHKRDTRLKLVNIKEIINVTVDVMVFFGFNHTHA